jgi:hypothetical protein
MGLAAELLLPSNGTARPDGMVARNSSWPTHFTFAVGMVCSCKISRYDLRNKL